MFSRADWFGLVLSLDAPQHQVAKAEILDWPGRSSLAYCPNQKGRDAQFELQTDVPIWWVVGMAAVQNSTARLYDRTSRK
jgi:hypothetical protein